MLRKLKHLTEYVGVINRNKFHILQNLTYKGQTKPLNKFTHHSVTQNVFSRCDMLLQVTKSAQDDTVVKSIYKDGGTYTKPP